MGRIMSDAPFPQRQQETIQWLKQQRFENVTATPERLQQFKTELLEKLSELEVRVPGQAPDATTLLYSGRVGFYKHRSRKPS